MFKDFRVNQSEWLGLIPTPHELQAQKESDEAIRQQRMEKTRATLRNDMYPRFYMRATELGLVQACTETMRHMLYALCDQAVEAHFPAAGDSSTLKHRLTRMQPTYQAMVEECEERGIRPSDTRHLLNAVVRETDERAEAFANDAKARPVDMPKPEPEVAAAIQRSEHQIARDKGHGNYVATMVKRLRLDRALPTHRMKPDSDDMQMLNARIEERCGSEFALREWLTQQMEDVTDPNQRLSLRKTLVISMLGSDASNLYLARAALEEETVALAQALGKNISSGGAHQKEVDSCKRKLTATLILFDEPAPRQEPRNTELAQQSVENFANSVVEAARKNGIGQGQGR